MFAQCSILCGFMTLWSKRLCRAWFLYFVVWCVSPSVKRERPVVFDGCPNNTDCVCVCVRHDIGRETVVRSNINAVNLSFKSRTVWKRIGLVRPGDRTHAAVPRILAVRSRFSDGKKEFDVLITTTAKMDTFQFETESTLLLFTINMSCGRQHACGEAQSARSFQ